MFLLRGLLIQMLEWVLNKLKGYTQFYNCMVPGCGFAGASNDPTTIVQLATAHDAYHRREKDARSQHGA